MERALIFTHCTKLGRVVDMLESKAAVQRDIDMLEKWTDKNLTS